MQFRGPQKIVRFSRDPQGAPVDDGSGPPSPGGAVADPRRSVKVQIGTRAASEPNEIALIAYEGLESSTMGIWLDGYPTVRVGSVTPPIRIEWRLYLGIGCGGPNGAGMVDRDYFRAVTIIKPGEVEGSTIKREGRLFQVDAYATTQAWLCGRVIDDIGATLIDVSFRTLFWPLTGRPELITGTAVG